MSGKALRPMPSSRVLASLLFICGALSAVAPDAAAVTRGELEAFSGGAELAWEQLTDEQGAVTDPLQPERGRFNYGTLMLADAQLRGAARVEDRSLADAAVRQTLGTIERGGPQDTYYLLAAGTMLRDGLAGRFPERAWRRLEGPLRRWIGGFPPYTANGFSEPTHYSNRKLVWAVGALALAQSGVAATAPGALAGDPAALRAEVARIVSGLAVRYAAPPARTDSLRPLRASSDRVQFPNAYHVFSVYLLELIHAADPAVFSPAALRLRERAGRYALALMAPDGQLTHAGRSLEQSWVLAAAAAYGARRAAQAGPLAGAYRSLADRAAWRLLQVHGRLADGTIPIVPGLRTARDPAITDVYASMTQYNGLTLMMLEDAAANWSDALPGTPLPADGPYVVSDLAGSGLLWGRAGDVWWAFSGRGSREDPRSEQGLVSMKVRDAAGWRDVLAARGVVGSPRSRWLLKTRRGRARLRINRVHGDGGRVRMAGYWRFLRDNSRHRRASVVLRVTRRSVSVSTPLRAGEVLTASVWRQGDTPSPIARRGRARPVACRVTVSGPACPVALRWRGGRRRQAKLVVPARREAPVAPGGAATSALRAAARPR